MTILNCSAYTCVYNQSSLCSRGSIEVQGKEAHISDDTCCASFRERSESPDSYQNSTGEKEGCEKIQITCQAENCTYNDCHNCTAAAIDISGDEANQSPDTCCDTFYCGNYQ